MGLSQYGRPVADPLRIVEHVHGHLGWLATALLFHPAVVLRDRRRRAHLAVALATGLVTVGAGVGAWLYVGYRAALKRDIFVASPAIGLAFERKEHLAFGAVVLAWAGCSAYFGAANASAPLRDTLRTTAFYAFSASAALSVVVAVLGTAVAVFKGF